jgi:hypothetical protein
LASLPYVDANEIYLGGHSTGGTMAMLVGACSDRYRAIFSLGPVAGAQQYGGDFVYCDTSDEKELVLRSPLFWLHSVKSPMYVFEGANNGNWDAVEMMKDESTNPAIQFFQVPEHDHFSVIAPLSEVLAKQIVAGKIDVTQQTVQGLR